MKNKNQAIIGTYLKNGRELIKANNFENALVILDTVLKINPYLEEAWINKGIALERLGRVEDAIKIYDDALKIIPDSYEILWHKASNLQLTGNHKEALTEFNKMRKIRGLEPIKATDI